MIRDEEIPPKIQPSVDEPDIADGLQESVRRLFNYGQAQRRKRLNEKMLMIGLGFGLFGVLVWLDVSLPDELTTQPKIHWGLSLGLLLVALIPWVYAEDSGEAYVGEFAL